MRPIVAGVYIDDAGTPGTPSKSRFLHQNRKSWCAVVIPTSCAEQVTTAMNIFLTGVNQDFGASELHFTEIYSGRDAWKNVPVPKRIKIFDIMSEVFDGFSFPIVYQTWSENFQRDHKPLFDSIVKQPSAWWDVHNIEHFGLILTLIRTKKYLSKFISDYPIDFAGNFPIFVDEGIANAGDDKDTPIKSNNVYMDKVRFARSIESPGLQLADYAAFVISRSQWLMAKQEKGRPITPADQHILSLSGKLNILNLDKVAVDPDNFSQEDYELMLKGDRVDKGLKPLSSGAES